MNKTRVSVEKRLCFSRSWSQCVWGLTFVCFSVEREEFLIWNTDQHKTNENLKFMSPVHVHCKSSNVEWSVFWRVHAQFEARLYTWRGAPLRGVLFALNPSNRHPNWKLVSRRVPGSFPHTNSLNMERLMCELHYFRELNAEPCPAWTTERGKLNEAGHLVTH